MNICSGDVYVHMKLYMSDPLTMVDGVIGQAMIATSIHC